MMPIHPNTTSFKPFWSAFAHELPRALKKIEYFLNRSPIYAGKMDKEAVVIFGWEFRPSVEGTFNGFRIFMDSAGDSMNWFAEFAKQKMGLLKKLLEKEKVDLMPVKFYPPTKIVFATLDFDATTPAVFLTDTLLQQKCITWGRTEVGPLFKVAQRFYKEFVTWVWNRSQPEEIPDRFT